MSTVTLTRGLIPNACRDVIGIRGVCDESPYSYFLDSLGISLSKAAKLADSSKITARNLVEEAVDQAWGYVYSDLKVQGFKVSGVGQIFKSALGDNLTDVGTHTVTLTRNCEFEQFFFNKVRVKVVGDVHATLTMTYNDTDHSLFDDDLSDETLTVNIDSPIPYEEVTFTLVTTGTGQLYLTGSGSPIEYDAYLECSEKLFYCKYWNFLVQAVMYKTAALILNASLFSDRYNDLLAYQKNDIAIRVSQLDSSLNLLNSENRINKYGLYQQEIDRINNKLKAIVKSCDCGCCFECQEYISSHITLP